MVKIYTDPISRIQEGTYITSIPNAKNTNTATKVTCKVTTKYGKILQLTWDSIMHTNDKFFDLSFSFQYKPTIDTIEPLYLWLHSDHHLTSAVFSGNIYFTNYVLPFVNVTTNTKFSLSGDQLISGQSNTHNIRMTDISFTYDDYEDNYMLQNKAYEIYSNIKTSPNIDWILTSNTPSLQSLQNNYSFILDIDKNEPNSLDRDIQTYSKQTHTFEQVKYLSLHDDFVNYILVTNELYILGNTNGPSETSTLDSTKNNEIYLKQCNPNVVVKHLHIAHQIIPNNNHLIDVTTSSHVINFSDNYDNKILLTERKKLPLISNGNGQFLQFVYTYKLSSKIPIYADKPMFLKDDITTIPLNWDLTLHQNDSNNSSIIVYNMLTVGFQLFMLFDLFSEIDQTKWFIMKGYQYTNDNTIDTHVHLYSICMFIGSVVVDEMTLTVPIGSTFFTSASVIEYNYDGNQSLSLYTKLHVYDEIKQENEEHDFFMEYQ